MRFTLALGLFVGSTYAATQLSPIALKLENWKAFKDCLGDEVGNYDVSVGEEWINVGPVDSRDPDFDGKDSILQKCMIDVCSRLQITAGYNEKGPEVLLVSAATEDWLRTSGAKSLEALPSAEDVSVLLPTGSSKRGPRGGRFWAAERLQARFADEEKLQ